MAIESLSLLISLAPNWRFSPGQVVMTIGVNELVQQGRFNPISYLRRHLSGDWATSTTAIAGRMTPR